MKVLVAIAILLMVGCSVSAQEIDNQSPKVRAWACPPSTALVVLGEGVEVSDDNTPVEDLEYLWHVVSEPATGSATILDSDRLVTGACLTEPGQYEFEILADDGELAGEARVKVTVSEE